jgi:hypothetical protein
MLTAKAIIRLMTARALTIALFILFAAAGSGQARSLTIPIGKGGVTISFPKAWAVSDIDRGLESKTPDEEVYVWAETFRANESDTLMQEHESYFTKQGVAITGKPRSETRTVNGLTMTFLDFPATWNGAPTVLQYMLIDPGLPSGWKLLMTEWGSPKGDKMYQSDLNSIMDSISFGKP